MAEIRKLFLVLAAFFFFSFVLSDCGRGQIDLNSASSKDLEKITWVGPATAEKIIDGRPWDSLDDLIEIKGIGEVKLNAIKEQGLACIDEETEEREEYGSEEKLEEDWTEINSTVFLEKEEILLNLVEEKNEVLIYESKNYRILRYIPYVFSFFLILVLALLIIGRS